MRTLEIALREGVATITSSYLQLTASQAATALLLVLEPSILQQ